MKLRQLMLGAPLLLGLGWGAASHAAEPAPLPTWAELMQEMAPIGDAQADKFADKFTGNDGAQGSGT